MNLGSQQGFTTSGGGGFPVVFLLLGIALVMVWLCASLLVAQYASRKGFPFWPIFIACFFISFPVVLLVVALVPPRDPDAGRTPPSWMRY